MDQVLYHVFFCFFLVATGGEDLRLGELEIAEAWSCVVKSSAGRLRCAALQVWKIFFEDVLGDGGGMFFCSRFFLVIFGPPLALLFPP